MIKSRITFFILFLNFNISIANDSLIIDFEEIDQYVEKNQKNAEYDFIKEVEKELEIYDVDFAEIDSLSSKFKVQEKFEGSNLNRFKKYKILEKIKLYGHSIIHIKEGSPIVHLKTNSVIIIPKDMYSFAYKAADHHGMVHLISKNNESDYAINWKHVNQIKTVTNLKIKPESLKLYKKDLRKSFESKEPVLIYQGLINANSGSSNSDVAFTTSSRSLELNLLIKTDFPIEVGPSVIIESGTVTFQDIASSNYRDYWLGVQLRYFYKFFNKISTYTFFKSHLLMKSDHSIDVGNVNDDSNEITYQGGKIAIGNDIMWNIDNKINLITGFQYGKSWITRNFSSNFINIDQQNENIFTVHFGLEKSFE